MTDAVTDSYRPTLINDALQAGKPYVGRILNSRYAEDIGYDRWYLDILLTPSPAGGGEDVIQVFADNPLIARQDGVQFNPDNYADKTVEFTLGGLVDGDSAMRFLHTITTVNQLEKKLTLSVPPSSV